MLLGCIADDLTGATDLALILTRAGMRTVQIMQVPDGTDDFADFDAVVVALKSRTTPAAEAVAQSLRSADALRERGARQLFFKYCSTFDSTDAGNIGPVTEALMERFDIDFTLACPAFPANSRTVYLGNLFVGNVPLSESSMRNHPLTPMRDSNLVRVLQRQTRRRVGLVPFDVVNQGADAIHAAFANARARGDGIEIVDALTDQHLINIGTAAADMRLITGGSGVAMGLPANFARQRLLEPARPLANIDAPKGRSAILAGSCSEATRVQISHAVAAGIPSFSIDPLELTKGTLSPDQVVQWALKREADKPILVYSSADPASVTAVQTALGKERAGTLIEDFLATTARKLVDVDFSRLIVAGGETSGAVVNALGPRALEIGPEIDPGVPWTRTVGGHGLVLALKSGNFGGPDFFLKAWSTLT